MESKERRTYQVAVVIDSSREPDAIARIVRDALAPHFMAPRVAAVDPLDTPKDRSAELSDAIRLGMSRPEEDR